MSKLTKLHLTLGLVFSFTGLLFTADVFQVSDQPACYIALPLGAVFLGFFVICFMLDKESARYDAENAGHH